MVRLALSRTEYALLEEIRDLGYGEVYEVSLGETTPEKVFEIEEEERNLINSLRRFGTLDRIIIHDGLPSIAEKKTTVSGRRAVKKIKF